MATKTDDEAGLKRQAQLAEKAQQLHGDDVRAVLSTGAGRRWFTWLMQVCGWGECRDPVDNNNRIDPLAVQRNEGARGVAMIVINDAMLHAPEDYGEIFVERARTAARLAKESKQ